jgi:ribonucleoside-diphosphate reductase alpha chain
MSQIEEFNVINRHGISVPLDFNLILTRLTTLKNYEPKLHVNVGLIAQNTIKLMINNITTRELDNISANICASMITVHPDYGTLASRIEISNLHKETNENFYKMLLELNDYSNENNEPIKLVDNKLIRFASIYNNEIQKKLNYALDYNFTYFGIKTLKKSYLLKHNLKNTIKILERPQHLFLRVSIGIHFNKIDENGNTDEFTISDIFKTYQLLSENYYTHATPTLFNAGTLRQSLSSCFLLSIEDDLEQIYKTLSDTAKISKWSGGIGVHCSQVRAKNSLIKSTNGHSEGIIPMLKVYNDSALYVSQGGGKRKGSTAVYLEPWHADVFEFLDLKKPIGDEYLRARDLFLALWIPDLFMKRLIDAIENKKLVLWSLFCPNIAKGLADKYGDEFEQLYLKYENEKKYNKQIDITILWKKILEIQMESGNPYLMFKDQVNQKGNQNNLGTIKSSNLCAEINIYTDKNNIGVCNLASICLPKFVEYNTNNESYYNYQKLYEITKIIVKNLNQVIDNNVYPVSEGKYSDTMNRPLGLGIQGLADVFFKFKIPFTSNKAKEINKLIFETIYFGALESSCELAQRNGYYKNYPTSMIAQGKLQFDLWNVTPSNLWNWDKLRYNIKKYGVYNSLLTALMPTASTSQIMGNYEMFEPITSNMFTRNTLSGTYQIINKYLIKDLLELNLWNDTMKQKIIANNGSIQNIEEIPQNIKDIYLTIWELKQKDLIDMDADRSAYVCQSSSSNRYVKNPNNNKLTSMYIYCWKKGLKTCCYYLRTQSGADAVKFTVDVNILNEQKLQKQKKMQDMLNNYNQSLEEECTTCSA